ncbi:hypothetical protein Hdeb2414_s0023g00644341 [Helianthus debilis subsp. tardiflorus]
MTRHVLCSRSPISLGPPPDPTAHLIAAMRQVLRRSLDSSVRSVSCSPTTTKISDGITMLTRSESCFSNLTLVDRRVVFLIGEVMREGGERRERRGSFYISFFQCFTYSP